MASLKEVAVPDIGDFAEVPIVEILVAVGDRVAAEDPLVTLESDKASMDIPAPFAGTVAEIRVALGDIVSAGSALMAFASDAEATSTASPPAAASPTPAARPTPAPPARPTAPAAASSELPATSPTHAGPGARRRARELGIELTAVRGSGRKGRITAADIEAAAVAPKAPTAASAQPQGSVLGLQLPTWPKVDFESFGPVERRKLPRIRQIAGPALQRNAIVIPHVTQHDEADISGLEDFRVRTNTEQADRGVKLTMVGLLLKACVATLKEFPEFNASLDGDELVLKSYYHLGFAADTPTGLVVPVIRDVDRKGLFEIAEELKALSGKAREGKLTPKEMQGGTFTISSLGGIGGTYFTPIVNAPEVAILGVSRAATKPIWNGSEFVPRLMLPLSLSYDHRVIDGAAAARFTSQLAGVLLDLRQVLL